jgi:hypothetical protein
MLLFYTLLSVPCSVKVRRNLSARTKIDADNSGRRTAGRLTPTSTKPTTTANSSLVRLASVERLSKLSSCRKKGSA